MAEWRQSTTHTYISNGHPVPACSYITGWRMKPSTTYSDNDYPCTRNRLYISIHVSEERFWVILVCWKWPPTGRHNRLSVRLSLGCEINRQSFGHQTVKMTSIAQCHLCNVVFWGIPCPSSASFHNGYLCEQYSYCLSPCTPVYP